MNQALQQLKGDIQLVVPAIEIVSIDGAADEIEVVSMVRRCPRTRAPVSIFLKFVSSSLHTKRGQS